MIMQTIAVKGDTSKKIIEIVNAIKYISDCPIKDKFA
jgi:hypothetical protein